MRFTVTHEKPKKKGFSSQTATFFRPEDAYFWKEHVESKENAKNVKINIS
jgi:hypothetical protein